MAGNSGLPTAHVSDASFLLPLDGVDLGITYLVLDLLFGVNVPANKSLAAPGLSIFDSSPRAVVHLWAADM